MKIRVPLLTGGGQPPAAATAPKPHLSHFLCIINIQNYVLIRLQSKSFCCVCLMRRLTQPLMAESSPFLPLRLPRCGVTIKLKSKGRPTTQHPPSPHLPAPSPPPPDQRSPSATPNALSSSQTYHQAIIYHTVNKLISTHRNLEYLSFLLFYPNSNTRKDTFPEELSKEGNSNTTIISISANRWEGRQKIIERKKNIRQKMRINLERKSNQTFLQQKLNKNRGWILLSIQGRLLHIYLQLTTITSYDNRRVELYSINTVNRFIIMMMQVRIAVLLLLLTVLPSSHCSEECEKILTNWIEAPEELSPIVYANSGKFLNDLGDYNNCQFHSDEYVYFTLQVVNRFAASLQNMGLCVPIECEEEIASNVYAKPLQDKMNEQFQKATNSTFVAFVNLKFYNPLQAQPTMDWTNYLTIGFLGLLLLLGLVGSILPKITQSQSMGVKVVQAFSITDNLGKILAIPKHVENDNLLILNGMRVLSIFWIVFGHDSWFRFANIKNWTEGLDLLTTPGIATIIPAAYFAVDTFFWIGGFLITMGMLEQLKKKKNFLVFYAQSVIHRFIRIWPTYMVAILMFWKIAPFVQAGPIWPVFYKLSCSCNDGGVLWNMFFIDNFEDHGPNGMDYCFGWGWYLAVDFQLFLITPFFLYAYSRNKKLGWWITFALFFASVLTAFIQIMVNDWRYPIPNPKLPPQPLFMDKFYYKPWIRASAYMMGVFSGFIYVEWKNGDPTISKYVNKIKNSIIIRTLFYIVGITLCELTIWIIVPFQQGEEWSTAAQAFYNSLNRVAFIIGVYLCIFAALFGCKNDPSRIILGHWVFSPLAKVSFCIYLTHFIVIMNGVFSVRMDLYWQTSAILYIVISDIFWSILLATCLSCLIEAPILSLERLLLRPDKKKAKQQPMLEKESITQPLITPEPFGEGKSLEVLPNNISPQREENNLLL